MFYLVEKARKEKKAAKAGAKKEDSTAKRSAYLEFLAAMGDIPLADKRTIWRDMSVKDRSKYQELADLVNSGQKTISKSKEEIQ